MFMNTHTHIYIYIYKYSHIYWYTNIFIQIYIHVNMCICIYVCIYLIYSYEHIRTFVPSQPYAHFSPPPTTPYTDLVVMSRLSTRPIQQALFKSNLTFVLGLTDCTKAQGDRIGARGFFEFANLFCEMHYTKGSLTQDT